MYPDWLGWALSLTALIWLGILSYRQSRQEKFLKSFFPKSGERDIRKKFDELLLLEGKLFDLTKESLSSVKKVALIRYNPYEDTGGDQSFSAALLKGDGSGIILTSLHSRSGTRVYAKPVIKGKADNFQFSREEEEAVEKALKS